MLLLALSIFLICFQGHSQKLGTAIKGGYIYEGKHYKSDAEISDLLKGHPKSYEYFKESIKKKDNAKVLGILSLASIGTGVGFFIKSSRRQPTPLNSSSFLSNFGEGLDDVVYGISFTVVGCVLGTSGILIKNKAYKIRKHEVVDYFNQDLISIKDQNYDYNLDLTLGNQGGIGIVLSF